MATSKQRPDKKRTTPDLSTVGGVAVGAAAGSVLGPLGAAVGALVGGIAGKNMGENPRLNGKSLSRGVKKMLKGGKAAPKKAAAMRKPSKTKTIKPTARRAGK